MPVIAPPLKATFSAAFRPLLAASAVRTLARTEMFMPMKPVRPEKIAPTANPPAVSQLSAKPSAISSTTPTIVIVTYCRLR